MSLSKSQKARLYGENTEAPTKKPVAASAPAGASRASSRAGSPAQDAARRAPTRGELAAEPERSSSFMFAGVAFVIAMLLFGYYHFWLLGEFAQRAGQQMPELMFAFDADRIRSVATGLGAADIVQYQFVHRSSGLVLPLIFAAAWLGMIGGSRFERPVAVAMGAIPVAYAVVFLAGSFLLDVVISNPAGPVGLVSLLMSLRWILFAACMAQLVFMAYRLVRSKFAAFSRGELPGQRG